ncbi:hypothetical protein [Nostoc sp. PA-18-2419]|uniref:hypothetical protein n=1 Tax=Nostoc sp. PA-18-2419 TaxID=2575443 RepID=UPI001109359E|nr:hypothetical protein [Nostoc sp. PA-18-2419]
MSVTNQRWLLFSTRYCANAKSEHNLREFDKDVLFAILGSAIADTCYDEFYSKMLQLKNSEFTVSGKLEVASRWTGENHNY